jgi:hypothetical protein
MKKQNKVINPPNKGGFFYCLTKPIHIPILCLWMMNHF